MSAIRVMVVDDDRDLRESIADLLADDGYEVVPAEHGQDALDQLRAGASPQVILLDLMMPEVDGYEFRARQLADPRIADIPVIAMSASGGEGPRIHELRARAFLRKPFDFNVLLALIEQHAST